MQAMYAPRAPSYLDYLSHNTTPRVGRKRTGFVMLLQKPAQTVFGAASYDIISLAKEVQMGPEPGYEGGGPALQDVWPDATCYGSGPANPRGLRIKSYWSSDGS